MKTKPTQSFQLACLLASALSLPAFAQGTYPPCYSLSATEMVVREGGSAITVTITRTRYLTDRTFPFLLLVQLSGGTAGVAVTNMPVFEAGETVKTFTLAAVNDEWVEGTRTILLGAEEPIVFAGVSAGTVPKATASRSVCGTTITLTIEDDDTVPYVHWSAPAYEVSESASNAVLWMTRRGDLGAASRVSIEVIGGTAATNTDFRLPDNLPIYFAPGETSKVLIVPIIRDAMGEGDEAVQLQLITSAVWGAVLGTPYQTVLTILDDDPLPRLQGQVRLNGSAGSGVGGITVRLGGGINLATVTDAGGLYAFSNLIPGFYTVTPEHPGYAFSPSETTLVLTDDATLHFNAALVFMLSGFVREQSSNGPPVPGVRLRLSGPQMRTALTDANGFYVFPKLPPGGGYVLQPEKAGYTFTNQAETVNLTNDQRVDFLAGTRRVELIALEVVQVIQDWANSVPLVADKPTYVRAHLQLPGTNTVPVKMRGARLRGFTQGTELSGSPLGASNPSGEVLVQADATARRTNLHDSAHFRLPQSWTTATSLLDLQFEWTNGTVVVREPAEANGTASNGLVRVEFFPIEVPQFKFFFINWRSEFDGGSAASVKVATALDLPERLFTILPVAALDWTAQMLTLV